MLKLFWVSYILICLPAKYWRPLHSYSFAFNIKKSIFCVYFRTKEYKYTKMRKLQTTITSSIFIHFTYFLVQILLSWADLKRGKHKIGWIDDAAEIFVIITTFWSFLGYFQTLNRHNFAKIALFGIFFGVNHSYFIWLKFW